MATNTKPPFSFQEENFGINIFSVHENCSGYERFYDDKLPGTSWGNRDVYKSVDNNLEA